jgi:hypothetical protein
MILKPFIREININILATGRRHLRQSSSAPDETTSAPTLTAGRCSEVRDEF